MSVIFGVVNFDERPAALGELDLMRAALAPHGPDGGGVWAGAHVGLGQLLMCFTPEDRLERQPLASPEGCHVLVTDGRVDNRPELAEELGIGSPEASAMPDSAFVLRAYRKWGAECCGRIAGDLAFALYDSREDLVLIARSVMCNRTLYYHSSPGRLAFASAPKGLFALPWVPREIDRQYLADYLVRIPTDRGATFFSGVGELGTGEAILADRKGFRLKKYWQPNLTREIRFAPDSDYVEAFTSLFDRVIADHLRSLTPVGVLMSGGLDSTSVAATAAAAYAKRGMRVATFIQTPRADSDREPNPNEYADETPLVQTMARRWSNLDPNFIRTTGACLLDGIEPFFDAHEVPFRGVWNRVWWGAAHESARSRGVRVLLTGAPGNFTISQAGEWLLPELIRRGKWLRALRVAGFDARLQGCSFLRAAGRGAAPLLPKPVWLAAARAFGRGRTNLRANPPWRSYSPVHANFARAYGVERRAADKGFDFHDRPRVRTRSSRYEAMRRWEPGLQRRLRSPVRCSDAKPKRRFTPGRVLSVAARRATPGERRAAQSDPPGDEGPVARRSACQPPQGRAGFRLV